MAFQVFKRGRSATTVAGDAGTIDLGAATGMRAAEAVVDLRGPTPTTVPYAVSYAPFPGPAPDHDQTAGDPFEARSDDAERISAWADRMRQKRVRDQATILGDASTGTTGAGYWSSEHVGVGDDPTLDPGVVADPSRRSRLLGELGLGADADSDDIASAYRRLAKQHHPDRWAEADEATRRQNAEEMMRVNAVYRALRINGDVGPRGRASTPPAPPAPGPR